MNLPGYLQPQGDGWRIDDAVTLWGLIHYEIAVGTPDTPEVKRLRHRARREVAEVATKNPGSPDPPRGASLRRRCSNWVTGRDYPSSRMELTRQGVKCAPSRTWVTVAALAGLCRQHGHPCPWEQEAEPAQQPVSAGRPGRPGRPSINAEAYLHIATLVAAGSDQGTACLDAASKYFPNEAPQKRAERLASGYRQHRKKALGNESP